MNDNYRRAYDGPPKKEWVIQKMPIKGGNVLRGAMLIEVFRAEVKWIEVEKVIES